MKKNYRKLYEELTNTKLPKDFDIHHINLNHNDNRISNLVALPKKLHNDYHKSLINENINFNCEILSVFQSGRGANEKIVRDLNNFMDIYNQCLIWIDYRDYLLGFLPNYNQIEDYKYE